jgi:diketogulonate reductase-like aldo/keto reductase
MDKNSRIKLLSGEEMPVLGLGSWQLKHDPVETIVYGLEAGFRMIDTSSDYGTQPAVGKALKKTNVPREDIYLITKVEETDDAYSRTKSNLEELEQEYADLMLIHRPPEDGAGEELWEGLIKAKKEGLVRDIGVSSYSTELIDQLIESSGEVPVVNQIEWSPFGFSTEMINYCKDKKIIIQAYSSLTRGTRLADATLTKLAQKYEKSPVQILIRWNLQIGSVPILKANQRKHIEENIDVFDFEISEQDLEKLNNLNEKYSSLGTLPY